MTTTEIQSCRTQLYFNKNMKWPEICEKLNLGHLEIFPSRCVRTSTSTSKPQQPWRPPSWFYFFLNLEITFHFHWSNWAMDCRILKTFIFQIFNIQRPRLLTNLKNEIFPKRAIYTRAGFLLRCQNSLWQTTHEMMHFQAWKNILINIICFINL